MQNLIEQLTHELDQLKAASSYRMLREIEQQDRGIAIYQNRRMFNLSGNDYLGIACDEAWQQEFLRSPQAFGLSSAYSRLLTGNHTPFVELEALLSERYQGKSALVFNSGYHANTGVLPALAKKGDLILADKLNHASLIDGLRLGSAEFARYRHLDYADLERRLIAAQGKYRQIFVVTESVFSMDGDLADLTRLVELKKKYGAFLMVDEAHSVGCLGKDGCGACSDAGLLRDVDFIMGTLGKAFGSYGAFGIMAPVIREYLINTMRPFIFTTGLAPINVAWTRYVLSRMPELESRRTRLKRLGDRLREIIRRHGYQTLGESQIVPLIVGENDKAGALAERLQEKGILVFPIRPPTVPVGTARLRFSLSSALPDEALDRIDEVLS